MREGLGLYGRLEGIVPDIEIALTREDIASGHDAALEFALR